MAAAALADKQAFVAVFDRLAAEMVAGLPADLPDFAREWVETLLRYTVPGGKMNRGLTVGAVLATLQPSADADTQFQAQALGWCIEWLQAFFLVADDIMDASHTRRGQPCWYKRNDVGLIAINDSFILESGVYGVLRRHFRGHRAYADLVDLFHQVSFQTELGQLLDLTTQPPGRPIDLALFTADNYAKIVKYKTAYYSFYLPITLGLILADRADEATLKVTEEICLAMGEYFQIQDDVLDCYGDPAVIGKIGTDIQDGKCSWLVVQALQRATSDADRALITEHYAKDNADSIGKIKDLYKQLDLERVFREYEDASYAKIKAMIDEQTVVPAAVFTGLLAKIYKRKA